MTTQQPISTAFTAVGIVKRVTVDATHRPTPAAGPYPFLLLLYLYVLNLHSYTSSIQFLCHCYMTGI